MLVSGTIPQEVLDLVGTVCNEIMIFFSSTVSVDALPLRAKCVPHSWNQNYMIMVFCRTPRFTHFTVHLFRGRLKMSMKSWT